MTPNDTPKKKPLNRERLKPRNPKPRPGPVVEPDMATFPTVKSVASGDAGENGTQGIVKRGPGRPKGVTASIPKRITDAMMEGLDRHGMDGKGKNGLPGYFYFLAQTDPKAMAHLIGRILPQKVQTTVDPQSALGQLLEAARAKLQVERAKAIEVKAVPLLGK